MAEQWASYYDLNPFKPNEWTIGAKTVKDLSNAPFTGDITTYKDWHDLMRDHLLGTNQGYGRVLYEIEKATMPIHMSYLQNNPNSLAGMTCDMVWISGQPWTCVCHAMLVRPSGRP